MTEYQDMQATENYEALGWYFVGLAGENEDGWKVYQTVNGDLFAIDTESDGISFEVYEEDGIFTVY